MTEITCGRSVPADIWTACAMCTARAGEDCPLLSESMVVLLNRQGIVTAGQAAACNPDDGVCEACQ
jgi:hypothetical protein